MSRRVSVIIPVYNVVTFLEEALGSVLSQDYSDIEVIVVNDGSTEEASRVIEMLCAKDSRIHLVNQPNQGPAMARCNGVKAASGEYIIFLDADDLLLPGAISYLAEGLDTYPSAIGVYGKKAQVDVKGVRLDSYSLPKPDTLASGNVLPALLQGIGLFSHGNIALRREVVRTLDFPPDIRHSEDWVTWCRLALLGDIIYLGNRILLHLRLHEKSVSIAALDNPALVFSSFDMVFKDPRFANALGKANIASFRRTYRRRIHLYLSYHSFDHGRKVRAWKHKMIAKYLVRKW